MFDFGLLPSNTYNIPVICVGNLSMGGTGKTPFTEYIARKVAEPEFPVAILSRGYKRKTRGFIIVEENHTHRDVGDESCQYIRRLKNENIIIAVDANRRRGIRKLLEKCPALKAIFLDDAYQHRYVKAGLNILLTDYYSPYYKDYIYPFGNLREPRSGMKRADIIVISKSPPVVSPIVRRDIIPKIKIKPEQNLYFSNIVYDNITSIDDVTQLDRNVFFSTIFLFTGIENPYPLKEHLKSYCLIVELFMFQDHHDYKISDIKKIVKRFEGHLSSKKIIVTTEKDKIRLQSSQCIMDILYGYPVFYVPMRIEFDKNDKDSFNKKIREYVRKN